MQTKNIAKPRQLTSSVDSQNDSSESLLLSGEKVVFRVDCRLIQNQKPINGSLWISAYRLVFTPQKLSNSTGIERTHTHTELFLIGIHKMKKDRASPNKVKIWCKDVRIVEFWFEDTTLRDAFLGALTKSLPSIVSEIFAFTYAASIGNDTEREAAWKIFSIRDEFKRQHVLGDRWKLSTMNIDYKMCDSYPHTLAVPSSVTEEDLRISFGFRSRGRIPTLVWKHQNSNATISRTAFPDFLTSSNRQVYRIEDKKLIDATMSTNLESVNFFVEVISKHDDKQKDTLQNLNELNSQNKNERILIEDLSSLKESHRKLTDVCCLGEAESEHLWLQRLDSTCWLLQLEDLLSISYRLATFIENGSSVILCCSDDFDRTPQLLSLCLLMLDPYYRTLSGFQVLIEKEWIGFGHKFRDRCGYLIDKNFDIAPVFLQFLDGVWQLTQLFPLDFEFNSKFLVTLAHNLYTGLYGNFVLNSPQELKKFGLTHNTISLWGHLQANAPDLKNGNFLGRGGGLQVNRNTFERLQLWADYYLRWDVDSQPSIVPLISAGAGVVVGSPSSTSTSNNATTSRGRSSSGPTSSSASYSGGTHDLKELSSKNDQLLAAIDAIKKENAILQRQNKKLADKYYKLKRKGAPASSSSTTSTSTSSGGGSSSAIYPTTGVALVTSTSTNSLSPIHSPHLSTASSTSPSTTTTATTTTSSSKRRGSMENSGAFPGIPFHNQATKDRERKQQRASGSAAGPAALISASPSTPVGSGGIGVSTPGSIKKKGIVEPPSPRIGDVGTSQSPYIPPLGSISESREKESLWSRSPRKHVNKRGSDLLDSSPFPGINMHIVLDEPSSSSSSSSDVKPS